MGSTWIFYMVTLFSPLFVPNGRTQEDNSTDNDFGPCPPNCLGGPNPSPLEPQNRSILGKREVYEPLKPLTERVEFSIRVSSKYNLTSSVSSSGNLTSEQYKKIRATVPEIIEAEGFSYEEHFVTTKDGYILRLFRVSSKMCGFSKEHPPVFLQHGFLGTAADWLIVDGERALPFLLVDQGNDVWLGNSRGNEYSRNHTHLDPKKFFGAYWNFSFDEMGRYDLPAVFDYILETTGRPRLNYIGHSMGTTMCVQCFQEGQKFYVAMNSNPCKYNQKILKAMQLAPAAFLYRMTSVVKRLLEPLTKLYMGVNSQLNAVLTPPFLNLLLHNIVPELCPLRPFLNRSLCDSAIFLLVGQNSADANSTVIQRAFGHYPSTTSLKTLIHFLQLTQNRGFRQFDYGPVENMLRYGQVIPPKYRLFDSDVLTLNIFGFRDNLIDREDSEETTAQLGTTNNRTNILVYDYNHVDFIWGDRAAISVNLLLTSFIESNSSYSVDPELCPDKDVTRAYFKPTSQGSKFA